MASVCGREPLPDVFTASRTISGPVVIDDELVHQPIDLPQTSPPAIADDHARQPSVEAHDRAARDTAAGPAVRSHPRVLKEFVRVRGSVFLTAPVGVR